MFNRDFYKTQPDYGAMMIEKQQATIDSLREKVRMLETTLVDANDEIKELIIRNRCLANYIGKLQREKCAIH